MLAPLQVIAEDQSLLGLAEVQTGVRNALLDDAVSVREAAVDLVGRHIGTDRELALAYFDVMCKVCVISALIVKAVMPPRSMRLLLNDLSHHGWVYACCSALLCSALLALTSTCTATGLQGPGHHGA